MKKITKDLFIEETYIHLNKICTQNKVKLPPHDSETIEKIRAILERNWSDISETVLNRTKKHIYNEWKKDQKSLLYVHKGFHTSFRYALEKSIPRNLDQIRDETPWLSMSVQERLEILDKKHRGVFKEEMTFQKGTVEFLENYACHIPNKEFMFRINSAMYKCKSLKITEIERWNYISATLYEYIVSEKIDIKSINQQIKEEPVLSINPLPKVNKLNPFDAIDLATDKK